MPDIEAKEESPKSGSFFRLEGFETENEGRRKRRKRKRYNLEPSLLREIVGKYDSYPTMFGTLVIQTDGTAAYANGSGTLTIKKLTEDMIVAKYKRRDIRDDDDYKGEVTFNRSSDTEWRGEWVGDGGGLGAWFITNRRKKKHVHSISNEASNAKMLMDPGDFGKRRSQRDIPRTNYSLNKRTDQKFSNVYYDRGGKCYVGQKIVNGEKVRVTDPNEETCAKLLNRECRAKGFDAPNPDLPDLIVQDSSGSGLVASTDHLEIAKMFAQQQKAIAVTLQTNVMAFQKQMMDMSTSMMSNFQKQFTVHLDQVRQVDQQHNATERNKLEARIEEHSARIEEHNSTERDKLEARIAALERENVQRNTAREYKIAD